MTVKDALNGMKLGVQHVVVGYRRNRASCFIPLGGGFTVDAVNRFGHMEIVHSHFADNVLRVEVAFDCSKVGTCHDCPHWNWDIQQCARGWQD